MTIKKSATTASKKCSSKKVYVKKSSASSCRLSDNKKPNVHSKVVTGTGPRNKHK